MQDLVGKDRQESGRSPKKDREHVERDGRENHLLAQDKPNAFLETAPGVALAAAPPIAALDRQDQKEKRKRADGVQRIDERKARPHNKQTAERRTDDRSNLKDAAV